MHVTMVNKYYPPHLGGVEYHVRDLAEGLVRHEAVNVDAVVCNNTSQRVEETVNDVHVTRLGRSFEFSSTPVSWRMTRELRRRTRPGAAGRPDVVHLHFPYPWGELSWLRARPEVPSVVTYHSDIIRQERLLGYYRRYLERFLDGVDLIIASSPNMIEHSEFLAPRADKCRVIDFGIDTEKWAATPATLARAAQIKAEHGDRKVVLFVGRLVYYKGVDVLVKAMVKVDAELVLIGRGKLEDELHAIATVDGIRDRVTFLGPQDDAELAAWYHAADVFVLPSVARSEAFGLVQIEAHAAGTPVISTALTTGVPYANLDGVTGLIVPVGDVDALAASLRRILSDDELRARLGAQARERATTKFTIPRMCAETVDAYAEAKSRAAEKARIFSGGGAS